MQVQIAEILRWTVLVLTVPAAVWDVKERRVPNLISLPALCAAAGAAALGGLDVTALIALPVILAAWQAGWMGGGDAKILMALAIAFGPAPVVIATGAAGLAALLARRPMPGAAFALPAAAIGAIWS